MGWVSLIVGVLGAGGAVGVENTASTTSRPQGLVELVRCCVAGRPAAEPAWAEGKRPPRRGGVLGGYVADRRELRACVLTRARECCFR
jgi:hypothetical protein